MAVLNAGSLLSGRSATPLPFLKTLECSGSLLSGKQSSRMRILRFFIISKSGCTRTFTVADLGFLEWVTLGTRRELRGCGLYSRLSICDADKSLNQNRYYVNKTSNQADWPQQ